MSSVSIPVLSVRPYNSSVTPNNQNHKLQNSYGCETHRHQCHPTTNQHIEYNEQVTKYKEYFLCVWMLGVFHIWNLNTCWTILEEDMSFFSLRENQWAHEHEPQRHSLRWWPPSGNQVLPGIEGYPPPPPSKPVSPYSRQQVQQCYDSAGVSSSCGENHVCWCWAWIKKNLWSKWVCHKGPFLRDEFWTGFGSTVQLRASTVTF